MTVYEQAMELLDERFGQGRDNLISLATVSLEKNTDGSSKPAVRTVDAFYEDGVFYVTTYALSGKMQQLAKNPALSVAGYQEMFTANGRGENLGWVLLPRNAAIREKLRKAFAGWYELANNEQDENNCILAIRLDNGILNINHWEKLYHIDFTAKTATVSV